MQYQIIRSKRASISLQVIAGKVIVRAPLSVKDAYIKQLVSTKAVWITEKVKQQLIDKNDQNQFCTGGKIWFNGEQYPLNLSISTKTGITFSGSSVDIALNNNNNNKNISNSGAESIISPKKIKKLLETWLKEQAENYLLPQTDYFSQQMSLTPKEIKIRQYKSRWGSCNSLGNIQFNYLIMMAPKWVVDYVIVHELGHLRYLNHGRQFWQLVAQYSPNYRLAKLWLKQHQQQLQWVL